MSQLAIRRDDVGGIDRRIEPEPQTWSWDDMGQMANSAVRSGFFGATNTDQAISLMLIAQSEGKHPIQALREFDIIKGKPAMKSVAMLARFQERGGVVRWDRLDDKVATGTFSHPSGGSVTVTWDIAKAARAGLTGSVTWKSYPSRMLASRVISEAVKAVLPAVTLGIPTSEEAEDMAAEPPKPQIGKQAEADIMDDAVFHAMIEDASIEGGFAPGELIPLLQAKWGTKQPAKPHRQAIIEKARDGRYRVEFPKQPEPFTDPALPAEIEVDEQVASEPPEIEKVEAVKAGRGTR
jgi:hypothetical protein